MRDAEIEEISDAPLIGIQKRIQNIYELQQQRRR